jgi:hypothetical protein
MTQLEFDDSLDILFLNEIKFADVVAKLRKRMDPDAFKKEEHLMMFDNVMYALRYYDVTSAGLTDEQIQSLFELGTQLSLTWPK